MSQAPLKEVGELSRQELDRVIRRLQERRPELSAEPEDGTVPLSHAQERVWAVAQSGPRGGQPLAVALRLASLTTAANPAEPAASLAAALGEIVRRHPALRLRIEADRSARSAHSDRTDRSALPPVQSAASEPAAEFSLPAIDLSALPAARRDRVVAGLAAAAGRPFDLAAGLLVRALLVRLSGAEHALLLAIHPLAADVGSVAVLVAELAALATAAARRLPSPLPPPRSDALALARRERQRLAGAPLETLLAFWRARLAGAPPLLELAPDRPRAAAGSARVGRAAFTLPPELRREIEALGRRAEAPLSMTLLAGWKALLFAATGEEDLVVGAPGANRGGPEADGLIGRFATVLPLRTHLGGDPEMRAAVARVRSTVLASWAHPDVPYGRLAAEVAATAAASADRSGAGAAPLAQVGFDFRRAVALPAADRAADPEADGGVRWQRLEICPEASGLDVVLEIEELASGALAGALAYRRDLYDETTIARLAGHLASVLAAAAARPGRRLSALPLLSAAERHQVVREWNATAADYPRQATVHELFAAQAAATPAAVALVCGETTLTYAELAARAGRLAGWLRAAGVGPEIPVALAIGRSVEAVVAMLAVLAAGGAYLPLDPAAPRERLATMLADAAHGLAAPLVLVEAGGGDRLAWAAELGFRVVDVAAAERAAVSIPAAIPAAELAAVGPESLAYLMYTSGSTGRPKAVAVAHRGVVRLVRGAAYTRFGADEVFLGITALTFDVSTFEIWGALLNGGRLAILAGPPPSFGDLARALVRHGVTTLWLTAGLLQQMVEEDVAALAPLRRLLAGGDALPPEAVLRLRRELPHLQLVNGYGPTESTTFTTCWPFPPLEEGAVAAAAPIGRPIENTEVHVLDRRGRAAAIGVLGELAIGGDGLARGYLHRPDLTAERFRPSPFAERPGARLYWSGDLVRLGADGRLEFLGRLDRQVKVRGHRVELDEVEAALAASPGVREAAVAVREGSAADRVLVAFAAPRDGGDLDPAAVLAFLRRRLAEPMLPAGLVVLPELPLNDSGKIDRRALAAHPAAASPAWERRAAVAPRGALEEGLAALWAEVLAIDPAARPIGADDSFFALGGHSLAAARVTARIADRFGVELPLARVLEAQSLAALARAVAGETARAADGPRPAPRGEPALPGEPAPLSFAQERLWFLVQLEPRSPAYNMPAALRLTGDLDLPALAAAFAEIVRRHEVLRARFTIDAAGVPVQTALPAGRFAAALVDLAALPAGRREAAALAAAAAEAGRPFDLAAAPPLRVTVLRLRGGAATGEHIFLGTLHHIAADGWSIGVLVGELTALYAALRGRLFADSPLPPLPFQYADYARWQRRRLEGGPAGASPLAADLGYFRAQLAGAPALLELPVDRPRAAVPNRAAGQHRFAVDAALAARLRQLAQRHRATSFVLLLAAFETLLLRLSGQEDLVVGTPVANRGRAATERLIGFFVNTIALRADLSGDPSFREAEARLKKAALAGFAHQELPFEKLVEDLAPERSLSHAPLVQVVFSLQNAPVPPLALPGLEVSPLALPPVAAKFDLTCEVEETADGLRATFDFARDLFDPATVARWAGHLTVLLAAIAEHPDRRLSELALLSAAESAELLVGRNSTAAPLPTETLLRTVERWAAATPEAVAVEDGRVRLTYAELDRRAERLARRLAALGAERESVVGVALSRSAAVPLAQLAAWKAGAAYLPLDPAQPVARLAFQLADAAVCVALVDAAGDLGEAFAGRGIAVLRVDGEGRAEGWAEGGDEVAPAGELAPPDLADLAYVIYTSGSTGTPKGTEIGHLSLANLVAWHLAEQRLQPADRTTLAGGLAFDVAVLETWSALAAGTALQVPPADLLAFPERMLGWMAERGVTVGFLPTPVAELALALPQPPGLALRELVTGGDRLHRGPAAAATFAAGNIYGPAEATVVTTYDRVPPGAVPTIGRPIRNLRAYVVDRRLTPVPPGAAGELVVGGAGLGRGYLRRPALTAERFLPDPWSGEAGARVYRIGDLVRHLPDGRLDFLGRIDHQVKVRGFRVELGEIESVLREHPAVGEAAVVARPGADGAARLAAYVAPRDAPGADLIADLIADLRDHLRLKLPEYMVPADFVLLAALPLTANGKLDRRALPAPERREPSGAAPRTALEERVAAIVAELLGRPRVGVDESFFDLGGHSLLATRLLGRLRDACGAAPSLAELFEAPTPAGIAAAIGAAATALAPDADAAANADAPPPLVLLPRTADGLGLPLSFAQERLWFLDQLDPGSALYNIAGAVRLEGRLTVAALAAAFAAVARRHESLRTTFRSARGRGVQVIAPPAAVRLGGAGGIWPLPLVDLAALPAARREPAARGLALADAARPFDLAAGPLLRTALLRLAAGEHLLLLAIHHIVADGWSMGILVREVAAAYAALAASPPAIPLTIPLPMQYPDFAAWQRRWLAGGVLERQLDYWRRRLAGLPVLALPTDRPRPAVKGERGGSRPLRLPAALATAVAAQARMAGATPFMVLLLAFEALLARLAGSTDVAVGSPVANRARPELEGLIGFFVNTLVLRADLGGGLSCAGALDRLREGCLAAYAHQDLPFDRLVEELAPERDPSRTPLVQTVFALQEAPLVPLALPGLALVPLALPSVTAKFDLTLLLTPERGGADGVGGRGYEGIAEYDRALFDAATVERLVGHWLTLLSGLLADDGSGRLADLPLLAAAERHQLLAEWNDTAAEVPAATVAELFEGQAARRPTAVALVFDGGRLTYAQLDRAADRLAGRLRQAGIGPEARAAICLPRSAEFVVAILAVLKAGGAYVPLDPAYPRQRLALLLADAATPVLVTDAARRRSLPDPLPGAVATVLEVDGCAAIESRRRRRDRPPRIASGATPESPAYVMYTSGSTGRPKGVVVVHRGIVRLVRGNGQAGFTAADRWLLLSPLSFDTSSLEIWAALLNGGRLVIAPAGDLAPAEVAAALRDGGVTATFLTAGRFHQLVDQEIGAFAGVRHVHAGGDVLSPAHTRRLLAAIPGLVVTDGYGPTENSTYTSCGVLRSPAEVGTTVSIGRPVANSRVVIVDAAGSPVPIGVPGELLTGGDGLARGYLERPELTAAAFVPDPFSGLAGARLYRVGDLARLLPDGRLEFLGRLDHQVKVRGFRIELGEVEAALAAHPRLAAAAVVALPDPSGGKRLAAYVVGGDGDAPAAAELRLHLRARLPEHMVPAFFVPLAALPLTAHGKLDRRALPAPESSRAGDGEYAPPRDAVEELLADLYAEILALPRVGIHDDFFDLGGHSLLATQLASRLRESLGADLPLRRFFERPTVAELALEVAVAVARGGAAVAVPAVPAISAAPAGTAAGPLPLSFSQERLWILDRLEPGSAAWNIPAALRLAGPLDAAALAAALAGVVRRQASLRTFFGSVDGRPAQTVLAALPPELPLLPAVDLAALPAARREGELARLAAEEAAAPFDLGRAPLFRARLLRLADADWALLLTLHHIVGDGWSLGVLTAECSALYRASLAGRPPALAALAVDYADYAVWQRRHRGAAALGGQLDYWRARLAGSAGLAGSLELPTDRPRPAVQTYRGERRTRRLGGALAGRLRALGRPAGATLFMVLLAGFKVLLGRLAGEPDVAVGSPIAGRNRPEIEGLIGMFLNTLVLRTDLAGDPSFAELLARVRETALGAYAHQDVPFEMLLDALQPERDLSRTPFFQVYFNLLNFPAPKLDLPGVSLRELAAPEPPSKFDLTAYVRQESDEIAFELVYNADLFAAARIEELLAQLELVLAQAAADPARPIDSLSLLTPAAAAVLPDPRQGLDASWRGAVHELIAAQAAGDGGARPAVADRDGAWSYGELEAQANRLAHRLLAAGVGKGDAVAIYGHRSAALVWTVLGVLKAGAAFVILDPAYPAARQIEVLALAAPAAWLHQAAAGPLAAELASHLAAALPAARRLLLPAWRDAAASPLFAGLPATAPAVAVGPGDLAYLAFTSGSTGAPKGIEGLHGSLTHFLPWMAARYGFTPGDRFSMLSALAHDPLQRDIFTPLCLGAALAIPDPERIMAPGYLAGWMREERVTVANLTPAMAQVLTESAPAAGEASGGAEAAALPALRLVFLVGDVLTRYIVARLRRLAPRLTVVNHYGSTETQRAVGYHVLEPPAAPAAATAEGGRPRAESSREVLPLGRGVPGVQLLVLAPGGLAAAEHGGDGGGLPRGLAGIGEVGEIALRSPHIARGYRGDAALSGEKFLANPWTRGPFGEPAPSDCGDRLYRTGDLGRYLPDGQVTFAGRADHQVKIRGFRIELAEIEGRLGREPGVREAVVVARQEPGGDRRLLAFAVLEAGTEAGTATAAALRARLREQLPAYMVPAAVVLLAAIPLTPNGKIDRRALERHDAGRQEDDVTYRAPETDAEKQIAGILREVLQIEHVGVDDNFFELGGNSLLLVQVHARLQETFATEIPAVDIFNHPTVAALARYLVERSDGRAVAAGPAVSEERAEKLMEGRNRLRRRFAQRTTTGDRRPE